MIISSVRTAASCISGGIDEPGFAAIIDLDNGTECLYGNDVDIDDIIWMGPQPSVVSLRLIKEQCEIEEIDNAMYTADHPYYVGGIEGTLFPIPLKYIQLNSGAVMAQNPGWE